MSAQAPTLQQALSALIDALKESHDATFAEARRQYLDMRARGLPFPQELAAQLDAFFVCTTLTDEGALLGLLCGPCDQRHDDDAVFARIVDACARGGKTMPEVTAAFAHFGLAIPTTGPAMRAAAARTGWGR